MLRPASRSAFPTPSSPAPEIDGTGICGMTRPLKVSAVDKRARRHPTRPLTIDCRMIPALEAWLNAVVEPDAQTRFGCQRVATPSNLFGRPYSWPGGHRQRARSAAVRAMPSAMQVDVVRASRWPSGRDVDFVLTGRRPTPRKPPSCTRVHAGAAASIHDRPAAPGADGFPLQPTSTSILPITARPPRAPGVSASRRRCPTSCRRPGPRDGCARPRAGNRRNRSTSRI